MKRKISILVGVLALGLGAYCGARLLWAQVPGQGQPAATPAPTQTKVAFVNLALVYENYEKCKIFKKEVETTLAPLKTKIDEYNKNIKAWQEILKNPNLPKEEREKGERAIVDFRRLAEDAELQMRKSVGKTFEDKAVQLFQEVEQGIKTYATSVGFNVVLNHFEEPVPANRYHPLNIERKLKSAPMTGCCALIYAAPGLDITQDVLTTINRPFAAQRPAGASPSGSEE